MLGPSMPRVASALVASQPPTIFIIVWDDETWDLSANDAIWCARRAKRATQLLRRLPTLRQAEPINLSHSGIL